MDTPRKLTDAEIKSFVNLLESMKQQLLAAHKDSLLVSVDYLWNMEPAQVVSRNRITYKPSRNIDIAMKILIREP